MKFGSLFSGIGGFDLGLERSGMECSWQVEIDPYCQKVLAKHWPAVERFSDVRECGKHNLSAVDVICGGFPCQPFSVAGKQRGADDDRNLWPEMFRIVTECRPRWVVCENTPGIFGLYLDTVLAALESAHYESWAIDIPAAGIGAQHRRNRIWIIAHTNEFGLFGQKAGNATPDKKWDDPTHKHGRRPEFYETVSGGEIVANSDTQRLEGWLSPTRKGSIFIACDKDAQEATGERCGQVVKPNARGTGSEGRIGEALPSVGSWWSTEPTVCRMADGIPHRVDRLRALGNAVVPQVVELIGRAILSADMLGI
jgi:DNA (cytosine-5)-methyltransferase 1